MFLIGVSGYIGRWGGGGGGGGGGTGGKMDDSVFALDILLIITSAKDVMCSPGFVRLFVCEQDNSKTYGWILIKFSGCVRNGKRKK